VRALIQRVTEASVTSRTDPGDDAVEVGRIGRGLVALVGVTHDDDEAAARKLAEKVWHLRVFPDADGTMNLACGDVGGAVLVASQFTLYGDARKGRRPSYVAAARPEQAEPLVDHLVDHLRHLGAQVATGRFRTEMAVSLVNDGPVTVLVEV
jgi:D-tyrosyl-tRNA(Tyr) deacylase